jgi:hypothetical protein
VRVTFSPCHRPNSRERFAHGLRTEGHHESGTA